MRTTLILAFTFLLAITSVAQTRQPSLGDLKWMSGCWELSNANKKTFVNETWMLPAGDAMLGMARTVRSDKVDEFEYLRIVERGGTLVYIASPNGEESAEFKLVRFSKNELTFENKDHDFPERIIYKLTAPGKLLAAVEGEQRDRPMRIEYPMTRAKCF